MIENVKRVAKSCGESMRRLRTIQRTMAVSTQSCLSNKIGSLSKFNRFFENSLFRMIHLTMIARVYDGLPLTASIQDDNLTEYQNKGNFRLFSAEKFKPF